MNLPVKWEAMRPVSDNLWDIRQTLRLYKAKWDQWRYWNLYTFRVGGLRIFRIGPMSISYCKRRAKSVGHPIDM